MMNKDTIMITVQQWDKEPLIMTRGEAKQRLKELESNLPSKDLSVEERSDAFDPILSFSVALYGTGKQED